MTKEDLSFEALCKLIDFLGEDNTDDGEIKYYKIGGRLTRFFKYLTNAQIMILGNIVREIDNKNLEEAEKIYDGFLAQDGIEFVPNGDSLLKEISPAGIEMEMCEEMWKRANFNIETENSNNLDLQVYNAKTLRDLKDLDVKDYNYLMRRKVFVNKHKFLTLDHFKTMEAMLLAVFGDSNRQHTISKKVLKFMESQKNDEIHIFFSHFMRRLQSLYQDKNLTNKLDITFFDNLKKAAKV